MKRELKKYARIGLNHHCFYQCKDDPELHVSSLPTILNRDDIDVVDLTIPYGSAYREKAIDIVRSSGKTIVYNGYLMPTPKIPLSTLSFTEREQILMLAKDQVDAAYACGAKLFMQSVGADPGQAHRSKAFGGLGEYIERLNAYMKEKGKMSFVIELMDRDTDKKSLCGPLDEVMEFAERLKPNVPDIGFVLDLNHIVLMKVSFENAFTTCQPFLRHVHLGNCINLQDRSHSMWGGAHPPMGIEGGVIDVPQLSDIMKILLQTGYLNTENPGMMSLEIRALPGKTVEETIEDNLARIHQAWDMVWGGGVQ